MKRKILLALAVIALFACFFALSVSAAATNEFGSPETIDNIDLTGMNTDTTARVVIKVGEEYRTYPTGYIMKSSTLLALDFGPISKALGTTIGKSNVIRIEVPSNIEEIGYAGLALFPNLLEIYFFDDSKLAKVGGGGFYNSPLLEKINLPASLTEITGTQLFNMCYALSEVTFAEDIKLEYIPNLTFQNCTSLKKLVLPHSVKRLGDRLFDTATVIEELYLSPNLEDFGKEHFAWKQKGSLKIFAPAQLFEGKESVGITDFSWWNNDACLPSMTIFLTGTKEQADAIVYKSTYHKLTNATVSVWDSSRTTDSYVPESGWSIVYGYGVCDAFYGGEHALTGKESVVVKDFFTEIIVGEICTRPGCGEGTVTKTIQPIFTYLGTSVSEAPDINGKYSITIGYKVNGEAYYEYLEFSQMEFGLVASVVSVTGETPLTVEDGKVVAGDKTVIVSQSSFVHDYVDLKITGLTPEVNGEQLVMTMYTCENEKITYLNELVTVNIQ
ncbi:MAG: leucine-rich repeat protein [Clostridia bacterium]|nr:leucine-rich repeat protein [Clostridia bacterium]